MADDLFSRLRAYMAGLATPAQTPDQNYSSGIYAGQYNPLGPIAKTIGNVAGVAQALPVGMIHSAFSGLTAPGDAYNGKLQVMGPDGNVSQDAINRANDLAGLVTLGAGAAPQEANSLNMGIKAYHGSPHDFDQFSMDKIGTGEGAQAFGHGLYFAGNEGVAQGYRDVLSPDYFQTAKGSIWSPDSLEHLNVRALMRRTGDLDAGIAKANELLPTASEQTRPMLEGDIAALQRLKDMGGITQKNSGHMYEVNINADPNHLLDWDKPLSEQSHIQDALQRSGLITGERKFDEWNALIGPGGTYINPADKAQQAYIAAQQELGAGPASEAFKQAGIPGIKYLDAGSRGAGTGSSNYVVFDDNLINIVRKYGIAGAVSAGLITADQAAKMSQGQNFQQAYNSGNAT